MDIDFYDYFKNYPNVDLLKITLSPESYQPAAVLEATKILKTRTITQAEVDQAEEVVREAEVAAANKWQVSDIFADIRYNHQKWVNIILAITIFEYLHLFYLDVKMSDYVLHNPNIPFRTVFMLSFVDLLYQPVILYMFYKRMRWGWILFFGIRLATTEPTLLFYCQEYLRRGELHFVSYSMFDNLLHIVVLIVLWKHELRDVFKVNNSTRSATAMFVALFLVGCWFLRSIVN